MGKGDPEEIVCLIWFQQNIILAFVFENILRCKYFVLLDWGLSKNQLVLVYKLILQ